MDMKKIIIGSLVVSVQNPVGKSETLFPTGFIF